MQCTNDLKWNARTTWNVIQDLFKMQCKNDLKCLVRMVWVALQK